MSFVKRMPANVGELEQSLLLLFKNKGHVSSVKANESSNHLEVDLDWKANSFGGDSGKDFYLPIKRGKLREAKELADKMLGGSNAPTHGEAMQLYDYLDPQQG